ncbi:MAG: hypothetical protein A3J52_02930 [Omnitrophica bacterium RIFCSPHIGHO2_02_FULL_49_9]|nr:MAG: hypothetical protein A3J52_02930 [Omnitrophica bacterium RIFCSPHIGHO2_02_FULL_49_9]OGW89335.1 MAG: hypothetical protein A3A73_05980 [Omnitrophica bacterium RIFCSPLOWO2_01_FULL_50_24]
MLGYLSVKEMAERTGLSEERIRQLIRKHEIRCAIKLGGWLVTVDDFEAFLRSRMHSPEKMNTTDEEPPAQRKAG